MGCKYSSMPLLPIRFSWTVIDAWRWETVYHTKLENVLFDQCPNLWSAIIYHNKRLSILSLQIKITSHGCLGTSFAFEYMVKSFTVLCMTNYLIWRPPRFSQSLTVIYFFLLYIYIHICIYIYINTSPHCFHDVWFSFRWVRWKVNPFSKRKHVLIHRYIAYFIVQDEVFTFWK